MADIWSYDELKCGPTNAPIVDGSNLASPGGPQLMDLGFRVQGGYPSSTLVPTYS